MTDAPTDDAPTDDSPPVIARSSLRRNFAAMASAQVVSWVFATVTAIVVPRYLGPETQGRMHLVSSIWAFASVLIAFGTGRFIQLAIARDQRQGLSYVAPVLVVRTGWFLVSALAITVSALWLQPDRTTVTFGILIGVATLLAKLRDTFESAFVGLERMGSIAKIGMVSGLLGLIATILILVLGGGATGLLVLGAVTAGVWLVIVTKLFYGVARLDWSEWPRRSVQALRGSAAFVVVTIAVALYREVDVIVIARIAGDRDLGWYAAADRLSGSIMFPVTITLGVLFPTLGRLWDADRSGFEDLVRRTFSFLLLVATPLGIGVVAVGPRLSSILFGGDYSGTGVLLAIFGPVTIITFATTLLGTVALVSNRQTFVAWLVFGCAALTIPLDIVLVRWAARSYDNGAIGGMVAYAITEVLQFAFSLTLAPYLLSRSTLFMSVRVVGSGLLMLAAVWPLRDMFLGIPVAVGAVVYVVAIVLFRAIDGGQRQMIGEVLQRVRSGQSGG